MLNVFTRSDSKLPFCFACFTSWAVIICIWHHNTVYITLSVLSSRRMSSLPIVTSNNPCCFKHVYTTHLFSSHTQFRLRTNSTRPKNGFERYRWNEASRWEWIVSCYYIIGLQWLAHILDSSIRFTGLNEFHIIPQYAFNASYSFCNRCFHCFGRGWSPVARQFLKHEFCSWVRPDTPAKNDVSQNGGKLRRSWTHYLTSKRTRNELSTTAKFLMSILVLVLSTNSTFHVH